MVQKIELLNDEDVRHAERQRDWVRDHYDEDSRGEYDSVEGKLRLLETIVNAKWIKPTETWKLQSLGITFGDALAQQLGLVWIAVEDEYGRDPALQTPGSSTIVFPLTAISKRIERGDCVDVRELFAGFCQMIEEERLQGF
jgi:hypothetical protein